METYLRKGRERQLQMARFAAAQKKRQIQGLQTMLLEFKRIIAELDLQILEEERRSGIEDPQHFAYPPFARAALLRRKNLQDSVQNIATQHAYIEAELLQASLDIKKLEKAASRVREKLLLPLG